MSIPWLNTLLDPNVLLFCVGGEVSSQGPEWTDVNWHRHHWTMPVRRDVGSIFQAVYRCWEGWFSVDRGRVVHTCGRRWGASLQATWMLWTMFPSVVCANVSHNHVGTNFHGFAFIWACVTSTTFISLVLMKLERRWHRLFTTFISLCAFKTEKKWSLTSITFISFVLMRPETVLCAKTENWKLKNWKLSGKLNNFHDNGIKSCGQHRGLLFTSHYQRFQPWVRLLFIACQVELSYVVVCLFNVSRHCWSAVTSHCYFLNCIVIHILRVCPMNGFFLYIAHKNFHSRGQHHSSSRRQR